MTKQKFSALDRAFVLLHGLQGLPLSYPALTTAVLFQLEAWAANLLLLPLDPDLKLGIQCYVLFGKSQWHRPYRQILPDSGQFR